MNVLINGQPTSHISCQDRGLAYGDGIFRTLRVVDQQPLLWDWQWRCFTRDAERLGLPVPDRDLVRHEITQVTADYPQASAKITLTRGAGLRGYAAPSPVAPVRIVQAAAYQPLLELNQNGIRARVCEMRLANQPRLAGIKHLNRLENVLARSEWQGTDIREGILLDTEGRVIEGTMSNLFWVNQGQIFTPGLQRCGVAGALRDYLLTQLATLGHKVTCGDFVLEALWSAQEIFFCNSLIGIWPVVACEEWLAPVGPMTRTLQQILAEADA